MDGFSILDPANWRAECLQNTPAYHAGNAAAWLTKAGAVGTNHYLTGRLYVSKSGWLLLSVPNALVRGVFDAMTATGAELPTMSAFKGEAADKELLNAHISVMKAEEVEQIGADKINERGHHFHYALGQVREFSPKTDALSRVWAIQVASPELAALRKSYGLTPLPNGDHPFHITVAVRRKNVLAPNEVAKIDGSRGELKAAADATPQPRVRVVMPYQGKYLMETLNNSKWPQNIGKRRFMGGGIEQGETPEQAAAREMFEELGVKINPTAFRPLGNDPREGWQHEQYLELPKHKLKPGNFNASVGSDAVVTLSHGLPEGDDYMGPDIKQLLAPVLQKVADLLSGGVADNVPDSEFDPKALAEGKSHEREHTDDGQTAKEIAKDHLSEDPAYYKKVKQIEKDSSVYLNQALHMANPFTVMGPQIPYDHNRPVFENIQRQLAEVKRRGDFTLQADRNQRIWRASLDPNYRYQLALQAFRGELPTPGLTDQLIERYGDGALASLSQRR